MINIDDLTEYSKNMIVPESFDNRKITHISDAAMLELKFTFLPMWVEMATDMRIGQALKKYGKTFFTNYFGIRIEFHFFDYSDKEAVIMPFEEFVAWHLTLFAEKHNFNLI